MRRKTNIPFYVYRCPNCEREIELMRPFDKIHDDVRCPNCTAYCNIAVSQPFNAVLKGGTGAGRKSHLPR